MSNTGLGATLVFSNGISFEQIRYRSIDPLSRTVDDLDDTALDSAGFYEFVPDDLLRAGDVNVEHYADFKKDPPLAVPGTITITMPLQPNQSTRATISGSGYIKESRTPTLVAGQRLLSSLVIKFDGKTGPLFTPAT